MKKYLQDVMLVELRFLTKTKSPKLKVMQVKMMVMEFLLPDTYLVKLHNNHLVKKLKLNRVKFSTRFFFCNFESLNET